jgi:hypothetical protein
MPAELSETFVNPYSQKDEEYFNPKKELEAKSNFEEPKVPKVPDVPPEVPEVPLEELKVEVSKIENKLFEKIKANVIANKKKYLLGVLLIIIILVLILYKKYPFKINEL